MKSASQVSIAGSRGAASHPWLNDTSAIIALLVIVTIAWSAAWDIWTTEDLGRPLQYLGPEYDPTAMAYRLKFIQDGRVVFVDVDARTGQILGESH